MSAIRILLVDDMPIIRKALACMLNDVPEFEVVGEAADGLQAVSETRRLLPDVVVMDISMPRLNGIEATRRISAQCPQVRIVGLSMHDSHTIGVSLRQAGAVGYVPKGGSPEELVAAVRSAIAVPLAS